MFDSQERSSGTQYVRIVALLSVAFLFSPAVLVISRPFGSVSVLVALLCSILCVTLAWFTWKKSSELAIPSLETPAERAK
jgi:hypothetical protein